MQTSLKIILRCRLTCFSILRFRLVAVNDIWVLPSVGIALVDLSTVFLQMIFLQASKTQAFTLDELNFLIQRIFGISLTISNEV